MSILPGTRCRLARAITLPGVIVRRATPGTLVSLRQNLGRKLFTVRFDGGQYWIQPAPWKGSSDLVGLSRANALIMIPCRPGTLEPGETAKFLFME